MCTYTCCNSILYHFPPGDIENEEFVTKFNLSCAPQVREAEKISLTADESSTGDPHWEWGCTGSQAVVHFHPLCGDSTSPLVQSHCQAHGYCYTPWRWLVMCSALCGVWHHTYCMCCCYSSLALNSQWPSLRHYSVPHYHPTIISLSRPHTTLTSPSHHFTSPSHYHNSIPTYLHHSSPCERHPHHWCTQFGCGARDSTAKSRCTGGWVRGPDGSARPAWTQDQPWLWEGGPCQDHQTSRYSVGTSLFWLYWRTPYSGNFCRMIFLEFNQIWQFCGQNLWFHSKLTCPI